MAQLKDILAFLLKEYPRKSDFSNARVTKMVYLADWRQAIQHGSQISSIQWYFDNYGPFVWDVYETAQEYNALFSSEDTWTIFGKRKLQLGLKDSAYQPSLTDSEKASLVHVIKETSRLNWNDFIKLVYSTYPIMTSERYSYLNLPQKAAEYAPA